jgi:acetolactate synthase-1/2/3 large subunit
MNGAQAIAEILKREGVEQLFCFPTTPIMDACAEAGIRPIITRQERVAGNMADAFSRASNGRRIGVASVQQSAGAENAFAGLAQAFTDSSPILFLPGQWTTQVATLPPNFDSVTSYERQAKWADRVPSAKAVAQRMRRAFTLLRSGRPRPVLLEVPLDVAGGDAGELDYRPPAPVRSAADPGDVARAVDLLLASERPMIWAGQGVLYAEASAELTRLAELLAAPVTTTLMGKSAFDERHPLALGTASYSRTALVSRALDTSDAVFAIGASLNRDFTAPAIPIGKRLIHATNDADDLNLYYPADAALLGDAKLVLAAMIADIEDRKAGRSREARARVEQELAGQRAAWKARWAPKLASDEAPLNPYRVIGDFMKTFDPATTIVTHDSGGARDQLVPQYEATVPRCYLGWGHSTQLGFSLGAALGAKLACPDKLVAHFLGDAALGMVGMDLETGVRERIPILTVLLNNSKMGNYEKLIPRSAALYDSTRLSGDYTAVARGLGLHAERVEAPADIVPAFERARRALAEGTPALLEFITRAEPDIPYQG